MSEQRKCDIEHIRDYPDCFEDCPKDKCDGKHILSKTRLHQTMSILLDEKALQKELIPLLIPRNIKKGLFVNISKAIAHAQAQRIWEWGNGYCEHEPKDNDWSTLRWNCRLCRQQLEAELEGKNG